MTTGTKFTPTLEMVKAAEDLYVAMAFEQMVSPIVLKYQTAILLENKWEILAEYKDATSESPIVDPSVTYLMSDSDHAIYVSLCNEARIKAGLKIEKEGQCPRLVAQELVREARRILMTCMEPITKLTLNQALSMSNENFEKYVELSLKLITPHIKPTFAQSVSNGL